MDSWVEAIYEHLHQNPELSGGEVKTRAYLLEKLKELGIETVTYEGQNAVVGIIRGGKPGKTIALRADMDALPISERADVPYKSQNEGVMHACGHDAHMAIALGAAKILSEKKASLKGNVKFFFEPDEEVRGGGKQMVAAGCLENPKVDAVIGLHMNPDFDVGTVYTKPGAVSGSSTDIALTLYGKACHGAYPERGVDAIVIAAQVIMALQTLVSRNTSPLDSAVLSIGTISGGVASNVICEKVTLRATLRTLSKDTERFLRGRIWETAEGIAGANLGSAEVVFTDSYQSVVNDAALHQMLERQGDICLRKYASLGVESFSFFIQDTPGLYYDLGCGKGTPIHTDTFQIDKRVLAQGAKLQAAIVYDYLNGDEQA